MVTDKTPTFNLKAVIKETGIAADTLRAWERRYGLPMPGRTPGGHRLYSQRDIDTIKWLMEKQREGLSISRAVDLWNEIIASGQDPLPDPAPKAVPIPDANLEAVRKQWLKACLAFDENAAEQVLNQAFAVHPLEAVCMEVLERGLNEIGEMWYQNKSTVQQEHFASALAHRRLDALISATPPPTRPYSILIGCPPNEQHTFIPLLLSLLLRRRGNRVVYLGANVPIQRFLETIQSIKPHLIILSAQQLQTANGLRETAENLNASGALVAYGGRIFLLQPELRNRVPAHYLGDSMQAAIENTESLLTNAPRLEGIQPPQKEDLSLSKAFFRNQPRIDMHMITEAHKIGIPIEFSSTAVQHLGKNLQSALSLGHIEALASEMNWVEGLLREHNQNARELKAFLEAYARSVDLAMGEEGAPISTWLRTQVQDQ